MGENHVRTAPLAQKFFWNFEKTQVYPTRTGVPFLGFRHFGSYRRLKRENIVRFRRRMWTMQADYYAGRASAQDIGLRIQCWCSHAAHGNTSRIRNQILRQSLFLSPCL